jgi:putative spermidine/putrescine transport system ATP-binding protein/putrescine transport system ATP-binding protein
MEVLELVNVSKRFGDIVAVKNVSWSVSQGSILSLLGPSGCGKTTTLRLIAGFETLDSGKLLIRGKEVSGKRPYERNVGLLFQDYALFPHMTVAENVAYGLRYRGVTRPDAEKRTRDMLTLVKLSGRASYRPHQLSGGEQQRVALARALAINPQLVLLDEPLSALDAKLRQELRTELKEILSRVGATTIIVTHDQEEALGVAERVLVMNNGSIVQDGSPTDVYLRPNSCFVAEFIGRSNLLEGRMVREPSGGCFFVTNGIHLTVPANACDQHAAWVCVRPERIVILDSISGANPVKYENVVNGTVTDSSALAADVHLTVKLESGQRMIVVEKNLGQAARTKGTMVSLSFSAHDCVVLAS